MYVFFISVSKVVYAYILSYDVPIENSCALLLIVYRSTISRRTTNYNHTIEYREFYIKAYITFHKRPWTSAQPGDIMKI